MRFEAPIFHFRRRTAGYRPASHEDYPWLFTACACGLDVVECPPDHYDRHVLISRWVGTSSNPWPLDADRWRVGCVARSLADHHYVWRQAGRSFAGHHWLLSLPAWPRLVVNRRPPVRLEARRTCISQDQLQLLNTGPSNNQIFWLRRGCYFPSLEFAISLVMGLFANGKSWTIRSSLDNPL